MTDSEYMLKALELAKLGWGKTSPNPMVGALLVKNNKIIAEGYHHCDGSAHAEIECLKSCKESPEGATMYVTLEPCTTKGRTGACSDAIKSAKISRVVVGATDPNPLHAGKAKEVFKNANIDCTFGILEDECRKLNFIFNHSITHSTALLALKCAMSADGKIAESRGVQTSITSELARKHLMKLRALFGAIAVGAGTLESDNPSLTIRGYPNKDDVSCTPRFILSKNLSIAKIENLKEKKVFSDSFKDLTYVVCFSSAPKEYQNTLEKLGIKLLKFDATSDVDFWNKFKKYLYEIRISSIMIEGGAKIFSSICNSKAVDFACIYKSQKILGKNALDAFAQKDTLVIREIYDESVLAPDLYRAGTVEYR